jgi:hypothetical protein
MTLVPSTVSDNKPISSDIGGDLWLSSRSGARAGRGFHYQDVVGAWLTARILSGSVNSSRVVPEGYEDLTCEGDEQWQVQIKSRQERVGTFTTREVALFIAEMWEKHLGRKADLSGVASLVLVLERPIAGLRFVGWGVSLAATASTEALATALDRVADTNGWPHGTVDLVMQSVSIVVLPWEEAAAETRREIRLVKDIYPAMADMVGRAFREAIAAAADENAAAQSAEQSAGVDVSRAAAIANDVIGLVDRDALEDAIHDGLCEVISYTGVGEPSDFFEGVSAQPWHIAAGLPAPRPEIVGAVIAGLDRSSVVLLTGPSGVGKSTVLWASAYAMRDVLWYRVRRLDNESVSRMIRLARASLPTARSKVGFVVDGIGVGSGSGWDYLVKESALIPGVLLIGSARTEDLLPIRTLAECLVVEVELDEAVAERIFVRLKSTNRTSAVHWREAYEDANGLTLEYTYLLTRGRRLQDVLTDQIRRRVDEARETELRILALATTAHRWGGTLSLDRLRSELNVDAGEFRSALGRLKEEHLIVVGPTEVLGLHQLRSAVLSSAVHNFPPPALVQTLKVLVKTIESTHLSGLIAGALSEFPELEADLLQFTQDRIREQPFPNILSAVLRGLRIADFKQKSLSWVSVMDKHSVLPPLRLVAFQLAMIDSSGDLNLKPGLAEAIADIKPNLSRSSKSCNDLIGALGVDLVGEILGATGEVDAAVALMFFLSDTAQTLDFSETVWTDTAIEKTLRTATAVEYGNLIESARSIDLKLAIAFSELAGGEVSAVDRLTRHFNWLTEVKVIRDGAVPIVFARTLHISDELQGDADKSTTDLARVLLRCFAECESVDVQALRPGGLSAGIRDLPMAHSFLKRQYDHSDHEVAWNRQRAAIAVGVFGFANSGRSDRAALAAEVVKLLADYLDDVGQVWVTSRNKPGDLRRLTSKRSRILKRVEIIVPVEPRQSGAGVVPDVVGNDYLHSLADGVVNNFTTRLLQPGSNRAALAAFVGDSLRQFARKVGESEEWALIDQTTPPELALIDSTLRSLHAILSELAHGTTPVQQIIAAARAGRAGGALERAADVSRRAAKSRHRRKWDEVRAQLTESGFIVEIVSQVHQSASATEWPALQVAIGIHVQSVQDWTSQADQVRAILAPTAGSAYSPSLFVIPIVNGRPVAQLSQQVVSSFLPGESSYTNWIEQFPNAYETSLTNSMAKAHSALVELSGLALLSTMRETAELQSLAEAVQSRFANALRSIEMLDQRDEPVRAVLEYLTEIATRVHAEVSNVAPQPPATEFFSVTITKGMMQGLNGAASTDVDDFNLFSFMSLVCFEWDIDPQTARGLLASTLARQSAD